jgi:hypothetical protein
MPDGDWNSVQPLVEAWEEQHERDAHQGEASAFQYNWDMMRER